MPDEDRREGQSQSPSNEEWVKGFYGAYDHYSKVLRTWLVAYGIGGPVLILSSEPLLERMAGSGAAREVGILFLLGVGFQVLIAALNKATMWVCYYGELYSSHQEKLRYKAAVWFSEQFWVDFVMDVASIAFFARATYVVFEVVTIAT